MTKKENMARLTGWRTRRTGHRTLLLLALLTPSLCAFAGDPLGVKQVLAGLKSNWTQAQFSIDTTGLTDQAAVTDGKLQVEYEAAARGYLTCLRVSSHGDIRAEEVPAAGEAAAGGTVSLPVAPPLGRERMLFLFSDRPLAPLLTVTSFGADRKSADNLVRRITQLQAQGLKLATRRVDYLVEAPAGQTQYATRSVIRLVESVASAPNAHAAAPRFPTRIEFDFGSDRLTEASQRDLDVFGAAMLDVQAHEVTLEGHTDAIGSDRYNLELSRRRAAAAKRYLMESFGLPATRLEVTGKGKADPIAPNDTVEGRSQNRRVDFIFAVPDERLTSNR